MFPPSQKWIKSLSQHAVTFSSHNASHSTTSRRKSHLNGFNAERPSVSAEDCRGLNQTFRDVISQGERKRWDIRCDERTWGLMQTKGNGVNVHCCIYLAILCNFFFFRIPWLDIVHFMFAYMFVTIRVEQFTAILPKEFSFFG